MTPASAALAQEVVLSYVREELEVSPQYAAERLNAGAVLLDVRSRLKTAGDGISRPIGLERSRCVGQAYNA